MKANFVGAGNQRVNYDYYATPEWVTEALFAREKFEGEVWECASGEGKMSKVIEKYNKCRSSDIRGSEDIYGEKGLDFLMSPISQVENIITNPPYVIAQDFIEKAKIQATKKIAMLLKLNFLEGSGRYKMFQDKFFPLKAVYVFCKRLSFSLEKFSSGMLAYAWYIWDKEWKGEPIIRWVV